MTTLFFSPFVSDVDDPILVGPEVDDDDGKPDMWRTRGGEEGCYSWVNFWVRRRVKRRREKKRRGTEKWRIRKSKERTRRSGSGVELETTVSENLGVMDRDDDFRPDFEAMGELRVE